MAEEGKLPFCVCTKWWLESGGPVASGVPGPLASWWCHPTSPPEERMQNQCVSLGAYGAFKASVPSPFSLCLIAGTMERTQQPPWTAEPHSGRGWISETPPGRASAHHEGTFAWDCSKTKQ